ncbi:Transposase family tnp2 [Ceratobasidium sp. AG-Ba]|nr:Transposase family tnp2 [Ceratobasidium sp. AG-Ba]
MNNYNEGEISDVPSSNGSWNELGTPPPSPPPLPSDSENDASSDDEDGYQHVTAEDYREYDRWYAEDRQDELDEMIVETLTEEEMDSIKMMAIRQFGHISMRNYERIRYSFRDKIRLLSLQRLKTCVEALAGFKPEIYNCCVNVCHAFTGTHSVTDTCSICSEPRYDEKGAPRKSFQYIPTIPRFQAFFNNPALIRKLAYRHEYPQEDGAMNDFFDSAMYKDLQNRNIVVDGEDLGVKFFSGKYDIATSILTDGVQIFKKSNQENSSCWPIMLQILNLPPANRAQLRNVVPLCVIPGPNQPKDFDSFLVPFVAECKRFARGVETYNALTGRTFLLRQHPVLVGGDMQAIKHFEQMKGPNAKVPCRGCLGIGCYHHGKRTYYIPLSEPLSADAPANTTNSYDPLALPLRTETNLSRQLDKMESAPTKTSYEELAQKYGIAGRSILDEIPSIKRPTSYPHEFLHLWLLNHGPNLVSLWSGKHPGIANSGCEDYLISPADWAEIGRETEQATNSIPSAFSRSLPNIQTSPHLYCGESWSFWLIYVGPAVLRGRLKKKYYEHYLELVSILKCLLDYNNTTERIKQLRGEIAGYVVRFEEYYYQYNYDRLSVCKLTLHALLHVADDILRCGPVWVYWSFLIERYCREVIACANSRVLPWQAIQKFVLQLAQLSTVSARFSDVRKALLFGTGDAPVQTSRMEHVYPEYPETILRCPRLPGFLIQPTVRRRLAGFFRTNDRRRTFHQWLLSIPERCERWGKLRVTDGGDCIRSASATNTLSSYDKNQRNNKEVEMIKVFGYGRLDFILALTLPAAPEFGANEPQFHILAHITEAKDARGDASIERISYTKLGRSFVLDITSVKHVVGRVETRGEKAGREWVIVDRSESLCPTVFHQEEEGFDDDG